MAFVAYLTYIKFTIFNLRQNVACDTHYELTIALTYALGEELNASLESTINDV